MSKIDLFRRLPGIWKRLDREGFAERFLDTISDEYNLTVDTVDGLKRLWSLRDTPIDFLQALTQLIGYEYDDYFSDEENRRIALNAIREYSSKGTFSYYRWYLAQHDIVTHNIVDLASKLLILSGGQGKLSEDDCGIPDADRLNDGIFEFEIENTPHAVERFNNLAKRKVAGTKWVCKPSFSVVTECTPLTDIDFVVALRSTNIHGWLGDQEVNYLRLSCESVMPYQSIDMVTRVNVYPWKRPGTQQTLDIDSLEGRLGETVLERLGVSVFAKAPYQTIGS